MLVGWFGLLLLGVVLVLLSCFVFIGLSSDQIYESTNDSMPGVAKTATIVMMSGTNPKKKSSCKTGSSKSFQLMTRSLLWHGGEALSVRAGSGTFQ